MQLDSARNAPSDLRDMVQPLLEGLLDGRISAAPEAGVYLLDRLSESRLPLEAFLDDPQVLTAAPFGAPRYLAQVALAALRGDYDSIEEVVDSLQALLDRNPPVLEPRAPGGVADRVVVPEAKIVDLRHPVKQADGDWESAIVALVTSGGWRGREIEIRLRSDRNRTACFLTPFLWLHASIAAYNLVAAADGVFEACAETFLVIEPMRQVDATAIARNLHCNKPQLDRVRQGKGELTVAQIKGTVVHAMFDRLLEGETDIEAAYRRAIESYLIQLAALAGGKFDEDAFRSDAIGHARTLQAVLEANPRLLEDVQMELKRHSATLGIQGRIDAVFRSGNRLDILELKTGTRLRSEDHAQLFIYRLLLSDLVRRSQRDRGVVLEVSARLLSSSMGALAPLQVQTDFQQVLDARNRLVALRYALGREVPHFRFRYEGFSEDVCRECAPWTRNRCRETSTALGDRPDSAGSAEIEYFRRFTRMIERESWQSGRELAELLDDSRIEWRKRNFRAISGVRIVPDGEPFTFEFQENTADFDAGDAVLVHAGNISSTAVYQGYVRELDTGRLRVSIPVKNLAASAFEGREWIVDRYPSDMTVEAGHTALYDFLQAPLDAKKQVILGLAGPGAAANSTPAAPSSEAVERAAACETWNLIWGPPGTGKTKVIAGIVGRVQQPVLLGAFTNTAVDKMLLALLEEDPSFCKPGRFLRIGRASASPELAARLDDPAACFSEDLAAKLGSARALRAAMDSVRVVAATAHRACTAPYLRERSFEMTIVDEAGQLTEPLTLGLVVRSRRFVLVGDDRQLPPVVRTPGLAQSMFERLKPQAERAGALTLLETQYRMHPGIMAVSNELFYDGRLRSGVTGASRLPPDGAPVTLAPVIPVADGTRAGERTNADEAEVVAHLVRTYRDVHQLPAASIGVVSPFRAQVVLLRKRIQDAAVAVDTVERFQGGERDIMILSLVRSSGSGFVFDERRFNVAITRARRKLIIVAHPDLFRNSRYAALLDLAEILPAPCQSGYRL